MKHFSMLIIGAVILALISASAMATSKSDLFVSYKSQSSSGLNKLNSTDIPFKPIVIPTWAPLTPQKSESSFAQSPDLAMPTPIPSSGNSYFPYWFSPSSGKPIVSPTPNPNPPSTTGDSSAYIRCPPGIPVGPLTRTWCTCMSYINATTGDIFDADCRDSKGNPYPIGVDRLGNHYLVKPGCPCTWAE